jgi:hypothetical protein
MTIRTDELIPYMLILAAVILALFAVHSVRTGQAPVWVRTVDRSDQPVTFKLAVWSLVLMAAVCLGSAILMFFKVLT